MVNLNNKWRSKYERDILIYRNLTPARKKRKLSVYNRWTSPNRFFLLQMGIQIFKLLIQPKILILIILLRKLYKYWYEPKSTILMINNAAHCILQTYVWYVTHLLLVRSQLNGYQQSVSLNIKIVWVLRTMNYYSK